MLVKEYSVRKIVNLIIHKIYNYIIVGFNVRYLFTTADKMLTITLTIP